MPSRLPAIPAFYYARSQLNACLASERLSKKARLARTRQRQLFRLCFLARKAERLNDPRIRSIFARSLWLRFFATAAGRTDITSRTGRWTEVHPARIPC